MKASGAAVVAFDVPILDPGQGDDRLAQAVQNAMHPRDGTDPMPVIFEMPVLGNPSPVGGQGFQVDGSRSSHHFSLRLTPSGPALLVDSEAGTVRQMPFVTFAKDQLLYSLPFEALNAGFGNPRLRSSQKPDRLSSMAPLSSGALTTSQSTSTTE